MSWQLREDFLRQRRCHLECDCFGPGLRTPTAPMLDAAPSNTVSDATARQKTAKLMRGSQPGLLIWGRRYRAIYE